MKKIIMLIMIILILLITGCSMPNDFGLPIWTVPVSLVILNDTFDAEVIAQEVGSFQANGDTLQFFEEVSETRYLGNLDIEDTSIYSKTYSLGEFAPPEVTQFEGQPVNVLPGYPNLTIPFEITKDFDPFTEFEQIKFASGNLNITITNNTVFWLGNAPEGLPLTVQVLNSAGELLLEEEIFENIAPEGGSATGVISLADSIISNDITIKLLGEGDITDNESAIIDTTASGQLDVQITEIQAEYVINAQIPSQSLDTIAGYKDIDLLHPEIVEEDSFMFTGNSSIIFTIESLIPVLTSFELVAKRGSNEVLLEHNDGDPIFLEVEEGISEIVFSSDEYNINSMMRILPDGFDYSLEPFIGNGTVIPYLSFEDSLTIDFKIVADLQIETFEEDGIWIIPLENGDVKVETQNTQDFSENLYNAFDSGKIVFKYWNRTGMEIGLDLLVSDDSTNVYDQIFNFENPDTTMVEMFRVPLLEETGGDYFNSFELNVSQSDLNYFLSDSVFIIPRIHIYSNGENPWNAGLKVQAEVVIDIKVSDDLFN
ncbi:MAG: hypothetical protein K9N07_03275 [Candidatus Cloacimonetes bacterium]|nr:hypothetical protein [Candidatus Cloacimonadota bacterium]